MTSKILYLDDDKFQLAHFKTILSKYFELITYTNPLEAISFLKEVQVDAIISDMHMPIIDGLKFFDLVTENNLRHIPFFFLSSDNTTDIKIEGLKKGAFDFLNHSMNAEEIYIRINNRLNDTRLRFKNITIDVQRLLAFDGDKILDLTQIEFKILYLLIKNQGKLITRDEIKEFIWPNLVVLDKTINSHLTNLRFKVESATFRIISLKGRGIQVFTDQETKPILEL